MNNVRHAGTMPRKGLAKLLCRGRATGLLLAFGAALTASANAHETAHETNPDSEDESTGESTSAKGHGSISLGYQNTFVNGRLNDAGTRAPIGTVRIQSIELDLDYYLSDYWSIHAGIPFIKSRYEGPNPHCSTTALTTAPGRTGVSARRITRTSAATI